MLHLPEASIRLFVFLLGFWIEVSLRTLPAGSGAAIHSAGQKLQALGAGPVESRAPNPRHDPAYLHSRLLSAGPASFPCGGAQSSVSIQCRPPSLHTTSLPLLAPSAHGRPFGAPWPPVVPGPARRAPLLGNQQESAQTPPQGPLPTVQGT